MLRFKLEINSIHGYFTPLRLIKYILDGRVTFHTSQSKTSNVDYLFIKSRRGPYLSRTKINNL